MFPCKSLPLYNRKSLKKDGDASLLLSGQSANVNLQIKTRKASVEAGIRRNAMCNNTDVRCHYAQFSEKTKCVY